MSEAEHPWPFGGRIPVYENGVQVGWLGPIRDVKFNVPEGPDVEVVDLEIDEEGNIYDGFGKRLETTQERLDTDPATKKAVKDWFDQIYDRHASGEL